MVERCKTAYSESRRVRMLVGLGLCAWGLLLYTISGGFPPWAWRFLARVVSQLPQLWARQGSAIVVPLFGLILLSLSLLILWTLLLIAGYKVVQYWWQHLHEHEHFSMDLRDAEQMATEAVTLYDVEQQKNPGLYEEPERRREFTQPEEVKPPVRLQAAPARQQAPAVARASRVVGSSGLIRVPSAVFSAEQSFPDPVPQQAEEPRTRPMTVPIHDFPQKSHVQSPIAHGQELTRQAVEQRTQTQAMPRWIEEPYTQPMAAPTQEFTRQEMEQRAQIMAASTQEVVRAKVPQSLQATQPISHQQVVGRAEPLTISSVAVHPGPSAPTMRDQLRLVPRIIEVNEPDDVYNTLPIFSTQADVTTHATLINNELIEDEDEQDLDYLEEEEDLRVGEVVEPFRLLVGLGLDPGIARKDMPNEDNLFAIQGMRPTSAGPEPVGLFIVADGMGGHAHGQEASKQAVHALSDVIVPTLMRQMDTEEIFPDLLKDGVHRANLAIYRQNREQEYMMGTTLTAVLVVARTAYAVNVGDSRMYLYRPGLGMRQVTRDHSVVARLVEDGMIMPEEVYTHPKRNQIYRCLGERASVEVDTFVEPLESNDVLVLCSDGLWEMVHDEEMESIIASSAAYPSQLSKMLIQAALMRGGADNISVIVACIA